MNALRLAALCLPLLLTACAALPGTDPHVVQARYRGGYGGPCNSWVTSPVTYRKYCSSPSVGFNTDAAYVLDVPKAADESAFVGLETKTPDERKAILIAEGEKVYTAQCVACHQATGLGMTGTFPPLAGDPLANGGPVEEHIGTVLNGLQGKVIGGVAYAGAMAPFRQLTDNQIAAVVTYERNAWGNNGGVVEPSQVASAR